MCVREGASAPRWRSGGGCGGGKILQTFAPSGVSGSSSSVIWTTSSSPTSRPARARCRRLCADEDACQHSRCDDSSGPAGSWEWKLLLQGVAEASLHPMLLLMMEPRAVLLQALPSLEQAAQVVTQQWRQQCYAVCWESWRAPSWSEGIAPGLVGTVVRQNLGPLSGRESAELSVAPIKSLPSM